ncbi:Cyclic nucleotide-gated olfactory channel [Holothuria leucospilota]|uniref:Cyclic nucleotide-gated olfactory channel n=1 Tax=Holothuria leucospilota TaxID=206669 RepID=A0A9Q1CE52_HOLLE|nr:Cyclic nucleotide-gated olfactory channel [Holothuria leucospilota]
MPTEISFLEKPAAKKSSSLWAVVRSLSKFPNNGSTAQQKKRRGSDWVYSNPDSFIARYTTRYHGSVYDQTEDDAKVDEVVTFEGSENSDEEEDQDKKFDLDTGNIFVVVPDGKFNYYWLMLVTVAVLYNLWIPIARVAWLQIPIDKKYKMWVPIDFLFDTIYGVDIIVQMRTSYLEHGMFVENGKLLAKHYIHSKYFLFDLLSLLPINFIYFLSHGFFTPVLRFPRMLKVYRARQFSFRLETAASRPILWRILSLLHILALLNHFFAAGYSLLCRRFGNEGEGWMNNPSDQWSNNTLNLYLASLYWSTITLTTIGDVPEPSTNLEYAVQIFGYMLGVYIFATIVGQVATVVEKRNAKRIEFEHQVDSAKKYLREHEVPKELQKSVLGWYEYTWSRSKSLRGNGVDSLKTLPTKLRTELAIHVNLKTLEKVSFFRECEPEFLHDLVLRMQLIVATPGELVCRKGEVAREMFIVSDGLLEVLSDDDTVIRTLQAGDCFGEIGILMMEDGSNRRTANVRSLGYSDLFAVTKEDTLSLLGDYPKAEKALKEKAGRYLRRDQRKTKDKLAVHMEETEDSKARSARFKDRMGRSLIAQNSHNLNGFRLWQRAGHFSPTERFGRNHLDIERPYTKEDEDNEYNMSDDIAHDVMTSIEDILFSKLSRVSREYKKLHSRLKVLEQEIESLRRENSSKTND